MRDLSNEYHQETTMPQRFGIRVYYEDTDLAGIVYYANYLKYIERARSEMLRYLDFDQRKLKAETGHVFAVRRVEADYVKPAFFDDLLEVRSHLVHLTRARVVCLQEVYRGEDLLFSAKVTIACLDSRGRPSRLPDALVHAVTRTCGKPD